MFRQKPAGRLWLHAMCAISMLLVVMARPLPVAADPVTIPQGPLPAGELKPVELSYLTIDGTVVPSSSGIALEVRSRAGLRNADKKTAFERQVTFPGAAVSNVRVGTQFGGLAPVGSSGPWTLSLRAGGDAVIEGTQQTAIAGPVVDVRLDWAALKPWGAPLGAVRLTLHFPDGVDSDQLLAVEPAPTERDTKQLTWSYEKLQPDGQVHVSFIAPASWQPIHTARQAVSGADAGVDAYLALAAALQPLAQAGGLPAGVAGALQAEALAALERAVAAAPQDPRTHRDLGAHLMARANGDPAMLERAATELKAAYDLASAGDKAAYQEPLLAAVDELLAACRGAGDTQGTLRALDIVQAVDPSNGPQRATAYADLAVSLLQAGRQAEAEATIVAGFGPAALDRYRPYQPHFRSVTGEIETRIGERILRFSLVPAPAMRETAMADVAALADVLRRAGSQVEEMEGEGAISLVVTLPFDDPAAVRASGQAAAGSLSRDVDPAVRLVAAAAAPTSIDLYAEGDLRADRLAYAEAADLAPAQDALKQRQDQIAWARAEAETKTDDQVEAARRRWALALLDGYTADWQALVQGCRVTYRLLPPEDILAPQWALAWGEARQFAWSASIPRPTRLWPAAAALGVIILGMVVISALARRRT